MISAVTNVTDDEIGVEDRCTSRINLSEKPILAVIFRLLMHSLSNLADSMSISIHHRNFTMG